MILEDFDYDLPEKLIAQKPLPHREGSRMMVLDRATQEITHTQFSRFPDWLSDGDTLILNNSRVIPARVWGSRRGREIEFLFLGEAAGGVWEVLCRPAKFVRTGDTIRFAGNIEGEVVEALDEGKRRIRFPSGGVRSMLRNSGYAPLPPYIKRKADRDRLRSLDLKRYQTVYADEEGSIAAPTAGLHFTRNILEAIKNRGVRICYLTHEVGLATFQPVRVEKVEDHRMLEESYSIHDLTARAVNTAKEEGRPVIAVGTTSVRALESSAVSGIVEPGRRSTSLYIFPGYEFRMVDRLLTNFHLPRSTLLMLVSAFAGHQFIKKAYGEAVRLGYRFYSYGDCMYIL